PKDERFLEALACGLPPSGGNALGVDRLVALACGTTDIGEVIAFTDDEL
ncbi:MAG: amino acid--tRNA ligase-related protein, partial [Polyangiaceae bacterium]